MIFTGWMKVLIWHTMKKNRLSASEEAWIKNHVDCISALNCNSEYLYAGAHGHRWKKSPSWCLAECLLIS